MSRIVVFGAGGRAGRRVLAEAVERGHQVTAVVRDPARHTGLAAPGVTVVTGDATDAERVAEIAAGHDAVISSVYQEDLAHEEFYLRAARALLGGLAKAGVPRLVVVSLGTVLPGAPEVPAEYRPFVEARAAELATFRAAETDLDWLLVAPPPTMLDPDGERTGHYRTSVDTALDTPEDAPLFRYADLAVALVDEATEPRHHRTLLAVRSY